MKGIFIVSAALFLTACYFDNKEESMPEAPSAYEVVDSSDCITDYPPNDHGVKYEIDLGCMDRLHIANGIINSIEGK